MTETIWIALIGAVAALGTPWMNALAKRWLESRKGKKDRARQIVIRQSSTSGARAISKVLTFPLYAIAIWMFLIAPEMFADGMPYKGVGFLIISAIFVLAAHYADDLITGPPPSK